LSAPSQDQIIIAIQAMTLLEIIVAGAIHGINTPLGTISSNLDVTARSLTKIQSEIKRPNAAQSETLQQLFDTSHALMELNRNACDRICQVLSSLKSFVRLDEASFKEADINEGLDCSLTLIEHELQERIRLAKDFVKLPMVPCYPQLLNLVFMNLFVDTCRAIQGRGEIQVATALEGDHVKVLISYSENEVDQQNRNKEVPASRASLSLSALTGIMRAQGGKIEFESGPAVGRKFTIWVPLAGPRKEEVLQTAKDD
jgi:two-component system NtrC family sensor kinase